MVGEGWGEGVKLNDDLILYLYVALINLDTDLKGEKMKMAISVEYDGDSCIWNRVKQGSIPCLVLLAMKNLDPQMANEVKELFDRKSVPYVEKRINTLGSLQYVQLFPFQQLTEEGGSEPGYIEGNIFTLTEIWLINKTLETVRLEEICDLWLSQKKQFYALLGLILSKSVAKNEQHEKDDEDAPAFCF